CPRAPTASNSPRRSGLCLCLAVCDIPLYEICDYNITRDQCKDLGCCFYRGVCYKKAVPIYVHVFSVLIMLIAGFFVVAIVFRVIQEVKRETEISVEAESSAKISEAPEQTTTQDPSSLKPTSTDSTKRTTSQVDGRLPWTVRLCPCGLLFAYAPCL
uniref:Testis-expressed protein 29 n=1 Tax=Peromyscus maniculatus bairdii TaxID=230844 RepID=A0A8C8UNK2_PERMB